MLTTRHPVDVPYALPELEALFRYAREYDVEQGGRTMPARRSSILSVHCGRIRSANKVVHVLGLLQLACALIRMQRRARLLGD
jgi:hypothetical protein